MEQTTSFDLPKGLSVGDDRQTTCIIRSLNGLEYLNCLTDAEKILMVPVGTDESGNPILDPQLISSPALMSMSVLKASVKQIGEFTAPIPDEIWEKLSRDDINLMMQKMDEFETALLAVAQRGRSDPASQQATLDNQ